MRSHLNNQNRNFAFDPVSSATVGALLVTALFAACAPETNGRRTAVDVAKLCKNDPDAVFAGSCLQRSANSGDPSLPTLPDPLASPVVTASPTATPVETITVIPVASASPTPTPTPTEAPGGGRLPAPAGGQPPAPSVAKNRVLTFKQDSFIAVADKTVVMNCFMPVGTKVEFSGDLSEVTEFKKFGVFQMIVFKTESVSYPSGYEKGCSLSGRNFVYLSKHAIEESQP